MAERTVTYAARGLQALKPQAWGAEFPLGLLLKAQGGEPPPPFTVERGTAVIRIVGPLKQHEHFCFDSYDAIQTRFDAALETKPGAVALWIDSPGGDAAGCFELSRYMRKRAADAGIRLESFTDGECFSAAYALACAATRITVTSTGQVGSIGVFEMLIDVTAADAAMGIRYRAKASGERKMDKNPHVAISRGAEDEVQAKVDQMAGLFFDLVVEHRPMTLAQVVDLQGSTQFGTESVGTGLADQVSTWSGLIESLAGTSEEESPMGMQASNYSEAREKMRKASEEDTAEGRRAKRALAWLDDEEKKDKEEGEGKRGEGKRGEAEGDGEKEPPKDEGRRSKAEADDKEEPPKKEEGEGKRGEAESNRHGEARAEEKREGEAEGRRAQARGSRSIEDVAFEALERAQKLEAVEEERKYLAEVDKLLASRPDFAEEVVLTLRQLPIEKIREAVQKWPKRMGGRAAAMNVAPTRGQTQDGQLRGPPVFVPEEEIAYLDKKLGGGTHRGIMRADGGKSVELGFLTPDQAIAEIKAKTTTTSGR